MIRTSYAVHEQNNIFAFSFRVGIIRVLFVYLFPEINVMIKRIILSLLILQSISLSGQNINKQLQNIFDNNELMGMAAIAVHNDSIIYSGNFGLSDHSRNIPVTDSTLFRVASISKTVAATALMTLYDKGLFKLDDDISNILGFTIRNTYYPDIAITPRMLLSHTSGFTDGSGYWKFLIRTLYNDTIPTLPSLLADTGSYYTCDLFLEKKPGTYFSYSNMNFGIIGALVEKLSGIRFDIYCKETIFKPLGIKGSYRLQDIDNIDHLAVLYRAYDNVWMPQADNYKGIMPTARNLDNYVAGSNGMIFGPHASMKISAHDLSKLLIMQMNDGVYKGVRILHDSTARLMHKVQWKYNGRNGDTFFGLFLSWGLGFQLTSNIPDGDSTATGYPLIGHIGDSYGLISDMFFNEENKFGMIFITNGSKKAFASGNYSAFNAVEEDVFESLYKLKILSSLGRTEISRLGENYKTGFLPKKNTAKKNVRYYMPIAGKLTVRIFNDIGELVYSDKEYYENSGLKQVKLNTTNFPSGLYYCIIQSEGYRNAFVIQVSN